jgi:predicted amidohydrolase
MKVAMGQFAVAREWEQNVATCCRLMRQSYEAGATLLVLPEAILAADMNDPGLAVREAQPLDGPFLTQLRLASRDSAVTTIFSMHIPDGPQRVVNAQIALRDGEIIARYDKLHLYDAFAMQESKRVNAGNTLPPLVDVGGMKVGMMTCYDIRFPELARRLVVDGAEVLVLPSAWVRGPLKEHHWEVLTTARALENTCYLIAVGECGPRNIGNSMIIDPLGVVIARAAEEPALIFAELDAHRVASVRQRLPVLINRRFARPELNAVDGTTGQ